MMSPAELAYWLLLYAATGACATIAREIYIGCEWRAVATRADAVLFVPKLW